MLLVIVFNNSAIVFLKETFTQESWKRNYVSNVAKISTKRFVNHFKYSPFYYLQKYPYSFFWNGHML
jgi:hypothetical protein